MWHPFNFATGIGLADYVVIRKPAPVIILEGAYSSNPTLSDILSLTVSQLARLASENCDTVSLTLL